MNRWFAYIVLLFYSVLRAILHSPTLAHISRVGTIHEGYAVMACLSTFSGSVLYYLLDLL